MWSAALQERPPQTAAASRLVAALETVLRTRQWRAAVQRGQGTRSWRDAAALLKLGELCELLAAPRLEQLAGGFMDDSGLIGAFRSRILGGTGLPQEVICAFLEVRFVACRYPNPLP